MAIEMKQINPSCLLFRMQAKTPGKTNLPCRLTAILLCLLLVLSFAACGRTASENGMSSDAASDQQETGEASPSEEAVESEEASPSEEAAEPEESGEASAEASEEDGSDSSENSGLGPIVPWPDSAPKSVPELKNANITAVIPSSGSLTMMFETNDMDLIKAYVEELGKAGFEQSSLSENKFGLDYYGTKDGVSVFINFIAGGLSKLAIES